MSVIWLCTVTLGPHIAFVHCTGMECVCNDRPWLAYLSCLVCIRPRPQYSYRPLVWTAPAYLVQVADSSFWNAWPVFWSGMFYLAVRLLCIRQQCRHMLKIALCSYISRRFCAVTIHSAIDFHHRRKVMPSVFLAHAKALERGMAKYPIYPDKWQHKAK